MDEIFPIKIQYPITSSSFPSLSQSLNWMNEYFMRLQVNKNWKQGYQYIKLIKSLIMNIDLMI